jgi:hypothetical protein
VDGVKLAYWRTTIGEVADFIIEAGGKLLPIEMKATAKLGFVDCAYRRTFRQQYGHQACAGFLLHTGRTAEWTHPGRAGHAMVVEGVAMLCSRTLARLLTRGSWTLRLQFRAVGGIGCGIAGTQK